MQFNIERLYGEILEKSEFGADVAALEGVQFEGRVMEMLESVPLQKAYSKYI